MIRAMPKMKEEPASSSSRRPVKKAVSPWEKRHQQEAAEELKAVYKIAAHKRKEMWELRKKQEENKRKWNDDMTQKRTELLALWAEHCTKKNNRMKKEQEWRTRMEDWFSAEMEEEEEEEEGRIEENEWRRDGEGGWRRGEDERRWRVQENEWRRDEDERRTPDEVDVTEDNYPTPTDSGEVTDVEDARPTDHGEVADIEDDAPPEGEEEGGEDGATPKDHGEVGEEEGGEEGREGGDEEACHIPETFLRKGFLEDYKDGVTKPKKYTPCRYFFSNDMCRLTNCPWSHDETYRHVVRPWEPSLCRFFRQNKCKNGASCTYSHDEVKQAKKKKKIHMKNKNDEEEKQEKPHPLTKEIKEIKLKLHKMVSRAKLDHHAKQEICEHWKQVQEIENYKQ